MPITRPTNADAIYNQIAGEFVLSVNETQEDPLNNITMTMFNQSSLGVLSKSFAITQTELYDNFDINIKEAIKLENYTGVDLESIAKYVNVYRITAKQSSGEILVQGANNLAIPINSQFLYNNIIYISTLNRVISSNAINILSITRQGTVATVVFNGQNNLFTGCEITISGNSQAIFNITANVISVDVNKITFDVPDTGAVSGSGGILSYLGVLVPVISDITGSETNIAPNTALDSISVNDVIAGTTINGLSGGINNESDFSLNDRFSERRRNNVQNYTRKGVPLYIKDKYPEITNAKIVDGFNREISIASIQDYSPILQSVKVINFNEYHYFGIATGLWFLSITGSNQQPLNISNGAVLKLITETSVLASGFNTTAIDNSSLGMKMSPYYSNIKTIFVYKADSPVKTLSPNEIQLLKDDINNITGQSGQNYFILNFTKKAFTFTFTSLTPNILSLKNAIVENLKSYAKSVPESKQQITYGEYSSIIASTIDANSNTVQAFQLSSQQDVNLGVNEVFAIEDTDVIFTI